MQPVLATDDMKGTQKVAGEVQNLRILINNTDNPIWLVDPQYAILECNTAFTRWVSSFIGVELHKGDHVLFERQNKIYADKFESCYQLALSGHSFSSVEDFCVNGEVRYASVTFNPVIGANNAVTAISCYARDITDRRKHLLRIEEQNARLREIADIESHKVRGPVATILGLEQLFNYEDLNDPINKEIIQGITKMTKDLDVVIRDVVRRSNEINNML
jgi:signal transduction histidine kinase